MDNIKTYLSYNPNTGIFTWITKNTNRIKINDIAGHKNSEGYIHIRFDGKLYLAHRLAWLYVNGELPKKDIDHINEIKDDNRICNLRLATPQENTHNQSSPMSTNASGFRGVHWHKQDKKWRARITVNGKAKSLGLFDTAEEAHEAYLKAKKELHPFWMKEV